MREGRIKRRLREMIEALGYREVHLYSAQGYYRIDARGDVCPWTGDAIHGDDSLPRSLYSWDTMTACVRAGITIEQDERDGVQWWVWTKTQAETALARGISGR